MKSKLEIRKGQDKPIAVPVQEDTIPMDLKRSKRWVLWKYTRPNNSWTKVPFRDEHGHASVTASETWSTFAEVIKLYKSGGFDGIGFVLGDGYVGVDLDECLIGGKLTESAKDLLYELNSYTEVSPSGTGVKTIVRAAKAPGGCSKKLGDLHVELYSSKRYFCITGSVVAGYNPNIEGRQGAVDKLQATMDKTVEKPDVPEEDISYLLGLPSSEVDIEIARLCMKHIPRSEAFLRSEWIRIGMACKAVSPDLYDEWEDWSSDYEDFTPEECRQQWDSFKEVHTAGLQTLLGKASDYGYKNAKTILRQVGVITNYKVICDGTKTMQVPIDAEEIYDMFTGVAGPAKTYLGALFYVDEKKRRHIMVKEAEFFAYLHGLIKVKWNNGSGFVSKSEFMNYVKGHSVSYNNIEDAPHFPAIRDVFYTCGNEPPLSHTSVLEEFLDLFNPETQEDRYLILSALLTLFWGGPAGQRPAFIVTSADQYGAGKTSLVEILCRIPADGKSGCVKIGGVGDIQDAMDLLVQRPDNRRGILLDNFKSTVLGGQKIEQLITAEDITGKILYHGKVTMANYFTVFITGNDVTLSQDMASRVVTIRIKRGTYSPEWRDRVTKCVYDPRLLGAINAYLLKPAVRLSRYSRMGAWEGDVLSKLPNPEDLIELIAKRAGRTCVVRSDGNLIKQSITERLLRAGYNLETDTVWIPSKGLAAMLKDSFGFMTDLAARKMIEASIQYVKGLSVSRQNSYRGFVWGKGLSEIKYDLKEREAILGL
jgi:hypothetical protein